MTTSLSYFFFLMIFNFLMSKINAQKLGCFSQLPYANGTIPHNSSYMKLQLYFHVKYSYRIHKIHMSPFAALVRQERVLQARRRALVHHKYWPGSRSCVSSPHRADALSIRPRDPPDWKSSQQACVSLLGIRLLNRERVVDR